jgi:phosphatidylinositol alpha-1,6-mannosyltransferase
VKVTVTTESRLIRTPDGRVWTRFVPDYSILQRYLSVFDGVRVVARVLDQPGAPEGVSRVDGDGVEVSPVPHYIGPFQYLRRRMAISNALAVVADSPDAVILRVPSAIGSLVAAARHRLGLPYALEVIGDPYDVFAPGVDPHPLRPLLRYRFVTMLRRQCRGAVAVAYETEQSLQARYPAAPTAAAVAVSSVDLPSAAFAAGPRTPAVSTAPPTLISVGTLDRLYKGIDTLIEAVGRLALEEFSVRLVHIGIGRHQRQLERLVEQWGVGDRVAFAGWLPTADDLRQRLDAADLFVMPSRTEGLPRALIEAMARGLPAIGSNVGGIPELLPPQDLVEPDDPVQLAEALHRMLTDHERMATASLRNLNRSRDFSAESLSPHRENFYRAVRQATTRGLVDGKVR